MRIEDAGLLGRYKEMGGGLNHANSSQLEGLHDAAPTRKSPTAPRFLQNWVFPLNASVFPFGLSLRKQPTIMKLVYMNGRTKNISTGRPRYLYTPGKDIVWLTSNERSGELGVSS